MAKGKSRQGAHKRPTPTQRRAEREAAAAKAAAQAARRRRQRWLIAGGAVLVVVAVVIAAIVVPRMRGLRTMPPGSVQAVAGPDGQLVPQNASANGAALVVNPGVSAALTVDYHTDYGCPPCRAQAITLGPILEDLAARGEIVLNYHVRSYLDTFWGGTLSTQAALAATCADVVGRFPAYHLALFSIAPDQQHGYSDDILRNVAPPKAGITGNALTTFQTCFDNRQTENWLTKAEDFNANTPIPLPGRVDFDNGVRQAPAFFVNGAYIENPDDIPVTSPAAALAYLKQVAGVA